MCTYWNVFYTLQQNYLQCDTSNPFIWNWLFQKLHGVIQTDRHNPCIQDCIYTPLSHSAFCGWCWSRFLWWFSSPLQWICFLLTLQLGLLLVYLSQVELIVSKNGGEDTEWIAVNMWLYPPWHALVQTLQVWVVLWRPTVWSATCGVHFHIITDWTIRCFTDFAVC